MTFKKGETVYWHDFIVGEAWGIVTNAWTDSRVGPVLYVELFGEVGGYPLVIAYDMPQRRPVSRVDAGPRSMS